MNEAILVSKELVKNNFPKRNPDSNKGTFGRSVVIGGSAKFVGAPQFANCSSIAILSALGKASMRVGAGTSTICVPAFLADKLYSFTLYSGICSLKTDGANILYDEKQIDELIISSSSFAIGMGMDNGDAKSIVERILNKGSQNIVIDADALNTTKDIKDYMRRCILTPHIKEFSKLTGLSVEDIKKDPIPCAKRYAKQKNCIVLLKGTPNTYITDGNVVYLNTTGNVSLAKGGSGDVLSGIIVGLLAWGMEPIKAAYTGAYILGRCAEVSNVNEYSSLPEDIIAQIPNVLDEVMS